MYEVGHPTVVCQAAERKGGSTRDRGSGDVVGGELDAISISNATERSHAQRQDGDEARYRREDGVTMELVAHGARGNEEGRTAAGRKAETGTVRKHQSG